MTLCPQARVTFKLSAEIVEGDDAIEKGRLPFLRETETSLGTHPQTYNLVEVLCQLAVMDRYRIRPRAII